MPNTLITKVRITDPESSHNGQLRDIRITEGKISGISEANSLQPESGEIHIQEEGLHISPGWVDMHVQLADPGYEYKESLIALTQAAERGGFTTILCYPNTSPVIDRSHYTEALLSRARNSRVKILSAGSISQHAEGKELAEMYDMHRSGAVAFTDGSHPLQSSGLLMRALQYGAAFDALVIQYPVDAYFAGEGQMHEGKTSTLLGLKGIPVEAEMMGAMRDLKVLEYAGGRIHFHPLTDAETISFLSEKKTALASMSLGTNLTYLTEHDEVLLEFDTHFKVMPPIRDQNRMRALREALAEGKIDVIASGHAAQGLEEKKLQLELAEPGILGLQSFFAIAHESLIQTELISLERFIELVSVNPRKILGLDPVHIEENVAADFTLFQPDVETELNEADIPSVAKNSPYIGKKMKGKVYGIIA